MIDGGEAIRRLGLNVARYSGLAPLAAPLFAGVGAILMLHRVNRGPVNPLSVNRHLTIMPEFLDAVLSDLRRAGYSFVSLDEAAERLKERRGGSFVAVTADDAYRDNMTDALPVLRAHDAPLTIYVSPGLISGKVELWWEVLEEIVERASRVSIETLQGEVAFDCSTPLKKTRVNCRLQDYLTTKIAEEDRQRILHDMAERAGVTLEAGRCRGLMSWEELRCVGSDRLVTLGAHTVSHYYLRRLDDETAYREITEATRLIGFETGRKPLHMAYPYGYEMAVGPREVDMARQAGFVTAVTTRHGVLQPQHAQHMHALPRISLNGRYQNPAHIRTMMSGITTALANAGRRVVTV